MVNKILYVVMGSTGEYSDRNEWPVCGFKDLKKAQERVKLAEQRAAEIKSQTEYIMPVYRTDANQYDPNMSMDYTGTFYFIYEVKMEEEW